MSTWMIYGANGYTGRLCAEVAVARGHTPVLAGRRVSAILPLATTLGLPHRLLSLDDPDDLADSLSDIDAVLHCAGPFSATSRPMLDACLAAGAHYLDITGEISVFEAVHARDPEIRRAGIAAIPGVGFDVVPTDTVAARVGAALPTATRLELAFMGLGGGFSQGTAKSAVEGIAKGGAARIGGRIVRVPPGWKTRTVELGGKPRHVVSISWGDVSTAYHTTGIPDITTYMAVPKGSERWMKAGDLFAGVLGTSAVQGVLKRVVEAQISGPSAEERATGVSFVWARAEDDQGRWAEARLSTPEGYRFTALSSVQAMEKVLAGDVPPGALTPTRALGVDFIDTVEGVASEPVETGERNATPAT